MKYTWWQRPLVAPFLKETRDLKQHIDALQDLVRPILHVRKAATHRSPQNWLSNTF